MLWRGRATTAAGGVAARRSFETIGAELSPHVDGPVVAPADNDDGVIGWGTSWRMQGYLLMAEATGDPAFARRLADTADAVLAVRDSERGVRDFRGHSLPAWSATGRYTVVSATVPDTAGVPAMVVNVCPPGAVDAAVRVTPGPDGTFGLTVARRNTAPYVLDGLSLDPAHPRRADRVAYEGYTPANRTTVRLLPGDPPPGEHRRPRAGSYAGEQARVVLAAHTGMIVYPIAGLVRLAHERPEAVPPDVATRIESYLGAVHDALAAHDDQWRLSDDGEGYYVWLRDEPVSFAGVELPTNEFLTIGRALVQLAVVTRQPRYVVRAVAMARTLRRQMRDAGGVFTWPYWPSFGHVYRGWSRTGSPHTDVSKFRPECRGHPKPEDVTHALIDVDFACLYATARGLPEVFTAGDMRALSRTFTRHVVHRPLGRRPTVRRDVSGRGAPGTARHESHVACWIPLRQWNPGVAARVHAVHRRRRPASVLGVDAYCSALLARWE